VVVHDCDGGGAIAPEVGEAQAAIAKEILGLREGIHCTCSAHRAIGVDGILALPTEIGRATRQSREPAVIMNPRGRAAGLVGGTSR